jgi:hypothetical protein
VSSRNRKDADTAQKALSLKEAFEREYARREMERRAKEEAERKQQEADVVGAEQLLAALAADPDFLKKHDLVADRRRYTVSLDHERFRISAYFENGVIAVTLSDKRSAPAGASVPRRQENVENVPDALRVVAQFLVEETR